MRMNNLIIGFIIILMSIGSAQTVIENQWNLPDIGDNSDWLNDIAIDDSGYTYYCATLEGSSFITVGRLTPDMKLDWSAQADFGNNVGETVGLALDDSSLYVASNSGTFSNRNAVIYRYDKHTGKRIYKVYNNSRNTGDYITDIKLDKYSNVIISGISYFNADTSESFIFKFDKNLNYLWGQTYLAPIVMDREFNHLAVDDSGNVYVAGKVIIKLSPNGEVLWNNIYGADFIAANKDGQAITAVRQNSQWMIDKYDQNGNILWGIGYDDGASMGPITKMIIDDLDNIYVCGAKGVWGNESWHTVKINAGGGIDWKAGISSSYFNAYVYDLAIDRKGYVYETGAIYAPGDDLLSAVTIKYDPSGKEVWRQVDGTNNSRDDYGACISVNDSLTVVVGGLISDTENHYSGQLMVWQYQQKDRFKAIPDGWKFSNSENPMWQPNHWVQFDYSKPPYPYGWVTWYKAMPFDWPDWPVFVRAFGENQCYLNPLAEHRVYNPIAVKYWRSLVQCAKYKDQWGKLHHWKGSCYGFCLSSLLFYNNKLKFSQNFPGYERTFNIPCNNESLNMIHSYQIYPAGAFQELANTGGYKQPLSVTVPEIEEMLNKKRMNNKSLGIYNNNGSGGHAVVPCSLATIDKNRFQLFIYDPNYPGTENIIDIDTSFGIWYYDKMPNWGGTTGLYLHPDIELEARQPLLPLNKSGVIGMILFSTPNATTIIENPQGKRLGYNSDDGQIVDSIDNAEPIIPLTGTESPPIGYRLPDDAYKITTQELQDSLYTITLFSDSTLFSISRENCLDGETDLFSMEKGLRGIRYQNLDNVNKVVEIEGTTNLPGQTMTCSVRNITMSSNDSIDVNLVESDAFNIHNYGLSKSYNLRLEYAFEPGYRIFEHTGLLIDASYTHFIKPNWEFMDDEPLLILVDKNGDGSPDDTIEVKNEYVTGIQLGTDGLVPDEFVLNQNYPNPFNALTTIQFGIPERAHLKIVVYNILGQEVAIIANEIYEAGYSRVFWNASNYSSGIYFCRLRANSLHNAGIKYDKTIKMLLVK
jgi:hypothetical protein